jgi:dolichol kinase
VSPFWLDEVLRGAAIGAVFLLLFGFAEGWRKFGAPEPEWTRKFVHVAGGFVSLALPWVLRSHWTVLVLGTLLAGLLLATRRLGLLQSIHGVGRRSEGGIYFPIAIYIVFLLAADQPAFYLIAVLTLVVSDAVAALVGTTYGRMRYRVEGGRRTIEGSAVFLLATFLTVHLPLLLMTEIDRTVSVLVALQIALLVAMLEAISIHGNDNLIIPIGTYLLLLRFTPQAPQTLLLQLGMQLAILGVLFLLVWRYRMLTGAGTLASSLFFFAAWSLGGPGWLAAPIVALGIFGLVIRFAAAYDRGPSSRFQVLAVFYATLVASGILLLNNVLRVRYPHLLPDTGDPLYALYLGSLAANLVLLCLIFWRGTPWVTSATPRQFAGSVLIGVLGVVPAGVLAHPVLTEWEMALAGAVPLAAAAVYVAVNRVPSVPRERPWDGRLQAASVALGTLIALPLLFGTYG